MLKQPNFASIIILVRRTIFLLFLIGSGTFSRADGRLGSPNPCIYRVWEKEAVLFGFADSLDNQARRTVDKTLQLMLDDYLIKKGDHLSLQRTYPKIGQLTHYWTDITEKEIDCAQFRELISTELISLYHGLDQKKVRYDEVAAFEKEAVLWIGEWIKTVSIYSERVFAYYYKKGETRPQRPADAETTLHTLLSGRDGNSDRRRYNCETYSKGLVLVSGLFGLKPSVVSIMTVVEDYKGKKVNKKIVEDGVTKEIGHVCNLITLSSGTRLYYDQGILMVPGFEHRIVIATDHQGKQWELYSGTDSLWTSQPLLLGQTISDMDQIMVLDEDLTKIEELISRNAEIAYTDPAQTQAMRTRYSEMLKQLSNLPYQHIRLIATDLLNEKIQAVKYELQFQIDQLDKAGSQLKIQKQENQKVAEFNRAIEQYNRYNDDYRQLITRYQQNIPALKTALIPLRKSCAEQRDRYRSSKEFMSQTVRSADGRVEKFKTIVDQFTGLINNIDQVLGLPAEVKYLNVK